MKKHLSPVPAKTELLLGGIYLVFQWLLLPSLVLTLFEDKLSVTRLNCLVFVINFAVTVPIFRRFLKGSMEAFRKNLGRSLQAVLKGFGLYWLGNLLLSFVILGVDPNFANVNDANIDAMVSEDFGLMALCTVLMVPITEELLFRGIFFGGLYNRSQIAAFAVSTVVFALIHVVAYVGMYPPLTLLLCFLQYLPAGIALGWAWTQSGSILAPVAMHMLINAIGILAMR